MSARGATAFRIETRIARPLGATLVAPSSTIYTRQRASVVVSNQVAYVQSFDVEVVEGAAIVDPVVAVMQDGIVLEMCVDADGDDGDDAVLAYRATVSDIRKPIAQRSLALVSAGQRFGLPVTIQLPQVTSSEVAGVRRIVPGLTTNLGTLGTGAAAVDLIVRVTPVWAADSDVRDTTEPGAVDRAAETFLGLRLPAVRDFPAPGGEEFPLQDWLGARGDDLRIAVEALLTSRPAAGAAPLASLSAADSSPRTAEEETLQELILTSRGVPGAGTRVSLDEAYLQDMDTVVAGDMYALEPLIGTLRSGLSARVADGGRLDVTWRTSPRWDVYATRVGDIDVALDIPEMQVHERSVTLAPGRWMFPLGTAADGRVLALRVTVTPVTVPQARPAPVSAARGDRGARTDRDRRRIGGADTLA